MSRNAIPAPGDPTAIVRAMHEAYIRAAHAGDVKAAQALYADDVWALWEYEGDEAYGRAAIDSLIATAFANMTGLTLVLNDVRATRLGDGHLSSVGHWEVTYNGPDGAPIHIPVRSTEVLVHRNGTWQYMVQHVSQGLPPPG
ncbi:MAG: nuclear transport factor 2 family protein [Candidatus Binatia bacterium]